MITTQMYAVLVTIMKCAKRYGKFYSFPSESKILELLEKYHGIVICERTLRRILRALEKFRFIDTIHRTRIDALGRRLWTSNLYKMRKRAFMWLNSIENLAKGLFSHFRRPKLADYQLQQKRAFIRTASELVEKVLKSSSEGMAQPEFG